MRKLLSEENNYQMVKKMVKAIKIDRQGRILIPKEIRKILELDNTDLKINIVGKQLIITPFRSNIKQEVDKWEEQMKKMNIEAFKVPEEKKSKWFSEEYAKQKIGL